MTLGQKRAALFFALFFGIPTVFAAVFAVLFWYTDFCVKHPWGLIFIGSIFMGFFAWAITMNFLPDPIIKTKTEINNDGW